jgi:hypothetical protein
MSVESTSFLPHIARQLQVDAGQNEFDPLPLADASQGPPTARRLYFTEPAVPLVYIFATSCVLANAC